MKLLHYLLGRTCIFCGKTVDPSSDGICIECATRIREEQLEYRLEELDEIISVYRYKDPLRQGLHRFKYKGVSDLGKHCASALASRIRSLSIRVDLITCVPRAKDGLPRIYNQSEVIARRLAKELDLPFCGTLLKKRTGAKSQTECINAHARLRNAQKAYRKGVAKEDLTGKHILLVDDLYTTGATTQTCSEILLKMGAGSVQICTGMRAPHGHRETLHISKNYTHLHFDLTQKKKKDRYVPRKPFEY